MAYNTYSKTQTLFERSMAIRVDFYLLKSALLADCRIIACRLIEKAYQQGHYIFVYTNSLEDAEYFDELLWSFRDDSFLPHQVFYGGQPDINSPILISHLEPPEIQHDVLINLSSSMPTFYQRFNRILEIVPNEDNAKQQARANYRNYQKAECELKTHNL